MTDWAAQLLLIFQSLNSGNHSYGRKSQVQVHVYGSWKQLKCMPRFKQIVLGVALIWLFDLGLGNRTAGLDHIAMIFNWTRKYLSLRR